MNGIPLEIALDGGARVARGAAAQPDDEVAGVEARRRNETARAVQSRPASAGPFRNTEAGRPHGAPVRREEGGKRQPRGERLGRPGSVAPAPPDFLSVRRVDGVGDDDRRDRLGREAVERPGAGVESPDAPRSRRPERAAFRGERRRVRARQRFDGGEDEARLERRGRKECRGQSGREEAGEPDGRVDSSSHGRAFRARGAVVRSVHGTVCAKSVPCDGFHEEATMNRRTLSGLTLASAVVFTGTILTACVTAPPRGSAFVRVRPPAVLVEVRGTAPAPDHVWIPGYHAWRGSEYTWVPGHWDRAPRPHAVWVSGTWKQHRDGWYWVDGRWKSSPGIRFNPERIFHRSPLRRIRGGGGGVRRRR